MLEPSGEHFKTYRFSRYRQKREYEEYKKSGFKIRKLGDYPLTLDFDKKPE